MTRRRFGVEEELLLVDALDGHPVPAGSEVLVAAQERLGRERAHQVEHEFKLQQTEIGSAPCETADELLEQLTELRRAIAGAARELGVGIVAGATHPLPVRPVPTANDRYAHMADAFGMIARQQLTCGQHIHVDVESDEEGIGAIDRMAGWLSVIIALSANSPFWQGEDTGYSSYRTIAWGLWPTAGPTQPFRTVAGYRDAVDRLVASGTALDSGMIYFDARLSAKYPTVEVRVADVCTDVRDAVLVAVLVRALVETAAAEWRSGAELKEERIEMLRAGVWRAARSGLTEDLVDPRSGLPADAWTVVDALVEHVAEALAINGDRELVDAGIARLRRSGGGSERQRAVLARDGELAAVVLDAMRRTID
ncbi:YbdK family carboxylate-amine ligase [Nakamurella flava]|uniref:Putative glutamate--cysteine ligase 2 n=1 Tax=Nakamurella flava TaxID=2576308 RepID=A0A4V6CRB8_9ACTN|nr:glutamate--cysteine ligase [Nakamurella flava]TKV56885.1 YbdK family carboxylate-amine ligase [Nakamurella flava]